MNAACKVVSLVVSVLLCSASAAEEAARRKETVVLVHGAFADGSSWRKVIPLLQARGFQVTAVGNP
jgi:alpha-beta hydrolase superfamily lysophospholipase